MLGRDLDNWSRIDVGEFVRLVQMLVRDVNIFVTALPTLRNGGC